MSFDDPEVRPLLQLEGLQQWRPGAPPATTSSRRPSTGSASTARTARSWSRATRGDDACPSRRARLARVRRRRARARQARARRAGRPATWSRSRGTHPDLAGHLVDLVPPARPPLAAAGRRGPADDRHASAGLRAVRAGSARRARPSPTMPERSSPSRPPRVGSRRSRCDGRTRRARTRSSGSTDRDEVWTDRAARSTRRPPPHNGTLPRRSTGARRSHNEASVEAAVVQVMTFLIENEEAALVVPARFLGQIHPHFREIQQFLARHRRRRGTPHRGVHPPRHDDRPTPGAVDGRRAGVAADVARRTRLRHRQLPALRDGRGHLRVTAELPRTPRTRPAHPPDRPPHPQRRGPPRRVLARPSRTPRPARTRPPRSARPSGRATPPQRCSTPPVSTTTSSTRSSCSPPVRRTRTPPRRLARGAALAGRDERRPPPRLARLGFTPGEAETLAALHTRNFM